MSTRGLEGFKVDGESFARYNHNDSYPAGLGLDLLAKFRSLGASLKSYVRNLDRSSYKDDEFFNNRLSCEWAYYVNLDTGRYEVFCHGVFLRSYDLEALPSDTEFLHDLDLDKEDKAQEIEDSWTSWWDQSNIGKNVARQASGWLATTKQVIDYVRTGKLPLS